MRAREDAEEEREPGEHQRDHVDGAGEQEQDRGALGDPARRRAALDEQPGADGDAAGSADRHRGAERELAQGDARAEADRRSFEDLQEGEHVAEAREDLEPDRGRNPPALHVRERVPDPVKPRYCQYQADDERDQDRE